MRNPIVFISCILLSMCCAIHTDATELDVFATSGGDLKITFIGHGTLMFDFSGKIIHVDPYSRVGDYSSLPDADLVLITHAHGDHLDPEALEAVRDRETTIVVAPVCDGKVDGAVVLGHGDSMTAAGIGIEAVPAYNVVHMRSEDMPFHPKGEGSGFVLTFADTRVYIAGDTENVPEMASLENIDIAFLPMNLPYTMTPDMVAAAARSFKPKILYPYHYGDTDPERLSALLADEDGIEVRIRSMR